LQIVLLVVKAITSRIGGHGIADEMIRFNGYPFLEKEDKEHGDQAFIEPSECSCLVWRFQADNPVANVMKKDIVMMSASGVPLPKIGMC
jgi:chloride channel 3/4/5